MRKQRALRPFIISLVFILILLIKLPAQAFADDALTYIYTYTGNPYTYITTDSPFTTSNYVTVVITSPTPLYASVSQNQATTAGLTLSISDQYQTFPADHVATREYVQFIKFYTLNPNGTPSNWYITAGDNWTDTYDNPYSNYVSTHYGYDQSQYVQLPLYNGGAENTNTPGIWTLNTTGGTAAAPEPSTLLLLGTGLFLLVGTFAFKKKSDPDNDRVAT